jgi:hypothetical protein
VSVTPVTAKVVEPVNAEDSFEELMVTVPVLSVVAMALPDTNPVAVTATLTRETSR